MTIQKILSEVLKEIKPSNEEISSIDNKVKEIKGLFGKLLAKKRIADLVVGGSFAKGTIVKNERYDVDILVRFKEDDGNISDRLEILVKNVAKALKLRYERVHGSRDYFRIYLRELPLVIEVIPVFKINKPNQEKNVTDLTYFHVSYVKKHYNKYVDDIRLAKTFCRAQGVYGAESYIQGFSGYSLECLVSHYKGFLSFLKNVAKLSEKEIIDPARYYKSKTEILISMNESKTRGPIILVDPTYKERNVLAALNYESFSVFQKSAKAFLARPSESFFRVKKFDPQVMEREASSKKAQFVKVIIETDRQEGDIAGTKLKKFSHFLEAQISGYFDVLDRKFIYGDGKSAEIYFITRPKKEIIRKGPPKTMAEYVAIFKKAHKNYFVKGNNLFAKIKGPTSAKEFVRAFITKNREVIRGMGVIEASLSS